jgi:hypothetical protein
VAEAASDRTIHPADTAIMAAKYGFVYMVEYMGAYLYAGSAMVVSEPVWAPLTPTAVEATRASGGALVCRLKKHETYLADFDGLKMPVYDEIFILGDAGAALELPAPASMDSIPSYTLPPGFVTNINTFSDSIEFANSYDSEVAVITRPDPIMERVAANSTTSRRRVTGRPGRRPRPRILSRPRSRPGSTRVMRTTGPGSGGTTY